MNVVVQLVRGVKNLVCSRVSKELFKLVNWACWVKSYILNYLLLEKWLYGRNAFSKSDENISLSVESLKLIMCNSYGDFLPHLCCSNAENVAGNSYRSI